MMGFTGPTEGPRLAGSSQGRDGGGQQHSLVEEDSRAALNAHATHGTRVARALNSRIRLNHFVEGMRRQAIRRTRGPPLLADTPLATGEGYSPYTSSDAHASALALARPRRGARRKARKGEKQRKKRLRQLGSLLLQEVREQSHALADPKIASQASPCLGPR